MYDLPSAPDVVVALGTLLAGVAACCGAFIAYSGLDRWKKQGQWHQDQELARKLLLQLRKHFDLFRTLRSPFVSAGEMVRAYGKPFDSIDPKIHDEAYLAAINARFQRLGEAGRELYALLVEADVIWDTRLEEQFHHMQKVENEVFFAHDQLQEIRQSLSPSLEEKKERPSYRKTAFGLEGDEIHERYRNHYDQISSTAKHRLERR